MKLASGFRYLAWPVSASLQKEEDPGGIVNWEDATAR